MCCRWRTSVYVAAIVCFVSITPSKRGAGAVASVHANIVGEQCGPCLSQPFGFTWSAPRTSHARSTLTGPHAESRALCQRRSWSSHERWAFGLRMDSGDNPRFADRRARRPAVQLRQDMDALASQYDFVADGMPAIPNVYNWSALGLGMEGDGTTVLVPPRIVAKKLPVAGPAEQRDREASEQRLLKDLERLRAEHSDINEISDRLSLQEMGGAPSVHIEPQRAALKKRKLLLKDQMLAIDAKLAQLRSTQTGAQVVEGAGHVSRDDSDFEESEDDWQESQEEDEREEEDETDMSEDGLGSANKRLMVRLQELGLQADSVPPHKDSFFLALMKGLQAAGLRPRGYDFRESAVMSSSSQFPWAAKRGRQDVMALLSSQVHKLNGIGGWKLSAAEFKRYFSAAWWHVAAARHDLFMASAHLYSVRIVCLSIVETEGRYEVVEEIYDPPVRANVRATITLCRRGMHVISTTPDKKNGADPASVFAPPDFSVEGQTATDEEGLESEALIDREQVEGPSVRARREMAQTGAGEGGEDSMALLGLIPPPVEYASVATYSATPKEGSESSREEERESLWDDESGAAASSPPMRNVYDADVATKRVFITVVLKDETVQQLGALVANLRDQFPLDSKQLDAVVRWVEPGAMHITLQTLDVAESRIQETVDLVERTVSEMRLSSFTVPTGDIGCFWRAAGSSWGRVPRVIWLGLQDSPGMQELLRVQRVMDRACWAAELIHDQRPFCAHITLGKTKNTERMSTQQRRTLRGFGKWMQDQHRSLHLQQLLERDDPRAGGVGGGRSTKSLAPDVAQRRGRKRHKSWLAGGGGKKGGGVHGHVARQRDLGALNAELAAEAKVYADDNFIHPSIEVDALYVLESVKQEESNYRVYEILRCIPLAPTEREKDLQSRATGGNGDPATEAADRRGVANDETDTDTGISSQLSDESLSLSTPSSSLTSSERDSLAQLLEDLDQD